MIEAVVEGCQGRATVDGDAARLSLGCYELFGGDAASPGARRLVAEAARPRELVYGNDPAWRELILAVFGDGVFDRPMLDYDAAGLDDATLDRFVAALPAGFALRPFDLDLAGQLDTELEPHGLQVFASAADLAEHGLGIAIVRDGRLACAATSYTRSSRHAEVAIATRPAWRGQGLAAVAAAAFMRECRRLGLVPCWSASNPISQRLALRLGYRVAGPCEVLFRR
ncbi:MAG TPA: GNAT family N-acetyltransferase [Thermoanaerobaculia bacterium]|nr:GNAT family N-acetyltransferase [Thermoanaerobaculia bacterium]